MTLEIKPCPFCGGPGIGRVRKGRRNPMAMSGDEVEDEYLWHLHIQCDDCGATGGYYLTPDMPWNGKFDKDTYDAQQAIKKWNRRCMND